MATSRHLVIGTETAEWVVPSGVTALSIQAVLNSRNGSNKLQATVAGDAVIFFQSGGKSIREYYIPEQDTTFRSSGLQVLAPQVLQESPAVDFDFVSAPQGRIIVVRDDGIAVALLLDKSMGVMAWSRIVLGSGYIRSCATAPGSNGYDDVYFAVEDRDDGNYYLERLREDGEEYRDGHTIGGEDGTPYRSFVKSMPLVTDGTERQKVVKQLAVRFLESWFPKVRIEPGAETTITGDAEPYTGVKKFPVAGGFDRDVFFSFSIEDDRPCTILTVNAGVE
jgi:hypothetical protein